MGKIVPSFKRELAEGEFLDSGFQKTYLPDQHYTDGARQEI